MPFTRHKNYDINAVPIPRASGRWVHVFADNERHVVKLHTQLLLNDYATEFEAIEAGATYGCRWIDDLPPQP